jgi:ribose 5-phosphate isomerase B
MVIPIAADHAGFALKEHLKTFLARQGHSTLDLGTHSTDSMDYPDVAHPLAHLIDSGQHPLGIIICGSGNGVNMTVNKYANVRSALCWDEPLARLARQHNNANVLALPARFMTEAQAEACCTAFLSTEFEGGRHATRVDKMRCA